jgi:hypothetical protein
VGGVRARRLAIAAAFHAAVLAVGLGMVKLGVELASQPLFDWGGLLVLAHLLTFQRIPLARWLQQRLLPRHRCGRCGLGMDLVAAWRCACKHVSLERHAFSPCPGCGKGFAWVVCPGCGSGILI